ncbi:MAG: hypothetical protein M3R15_16720 [Acidobacteriota bacterium]|nr:hypothetical protein [Acidobacteriota bacterium]
MSATSRRFILVSDEQPEYDGKTSILHAKLTIAKGETKLKTSPPARR